MNRKDRSFSSSFIRTHKAEHAWLTEEEYNKKERFPSDDTKRKLHDATRREGVFLIEAERHMKSGKFTEYKTLKVTNA